MKPFFRLSWTLVLVMLSALVPGGCKPSSQAKGLESIRSRGELRIAMTGQFPPFNFYDGGELVGFDVDIANEIARRLKLTPRLITLRWDGILAGLTAGRYDIIVGSMAITEERKKAVDFSTPYYRSGAQVFVRPDSPRLPKGDLNGATVGVNLGTTYEHALRKREGLKEIRTYSGVPEMILDLSAGRIEAFVTDRLVGLNAATQAKAGFVPAGDPLYVEEMGIPMLRDQPKLRAAINEALADMMSDGTYSRISQKWFGRDIRAD